MFDKGLNLKTLTDTNISAFQFQEREVLTNINAEDSQIISIPHDIIR